jgi:glucosyl-dolichyl phosphate glucuronosyltransferase
MSKSTDISVLICTHNRATTLERTLSSFTDLVIPDDLSWDLTVVDNCSKDNTHQVIQDFARTVSFSVAYLFEGALGKSNALNTGVLAAKGDIVAFTDDDVILHPEWLASLKRGFEEFECAAIAGRVIPVWNQPKPDWLEMRDQQAIVNLDFGDEWKEIQRSPLGANSAFRKTVFSTYGLFRTDLGPSGERRGITCEDTEFGRRLLRAGEKIVYSPSAIVYHPVAPHRPTKPFFKIWYYNDGRSSVRANLWPESETYYFGIPRWMYRGIVRSFVSWIFSIDSTRRFQHKLSTYRALGRIVEARRLASAGRPDLETSFPKT